MVRIRSIAGYTWAVLAIIIVLVTFLRSGFISKALVNATGVRISPWWTGGEVVKTVDHGAYRTLIHHPVFDGLIAQRKEGFVQVNWEPLAGLPQVIEETVHYSGDAKEDFSVRVDTKTGATTLTQTNPQVISVEKSIRLENGWMVRVRLKK